MISDWEKSTFWNIAFKKIRVAKCDGNNLRQVGPDA